MRGTNSITRGLCIRYLWVDTLCIIQDSEEDWEAELGKVADVYGGAFLTLSAPSGADVHAGLPRPLDIENGGNTLIESLRQVSSTSSLGGPVKAFELF